MLPYLQPCAVHAAFHWPSVVGFWQQPAAEEEQIFTCDCPFELRNVGGNFMNHFSYYYQTYTA